ncbi:putative clathrin assembly protein At4g40080 [Ziziphus jujuba]|uniref:Clathrin assembly protein At4g40080 n=1 Tax=Ziziphus jujuba TaxID=326968 RepID=A0A6P4AAS1_ZIZJJ|nr:putative clathrin assembly protein At4g40080 [Ziziphus jujuba]
MGRRKKIRNLLGILKDKASLIKAAISINRQLSSINVAVLRATTHNPSSPPSENCIAAVLALGHSSRTTSCACIVALMDRLHATHSAPVALKCLFTAHNIATNGSFILKDQLSFYPSSGGQNFLNLSDFRDESDADTWELSSWVRWYAAVVEQNLIVSRSLGYYYSPRGKEFDNNKLSLLLSSELLGEIDVLVDHVERTCDAPENLNLQRNNLVYEVVTMVGEDYRLVQRELFVRLKEIEDRMESLSSSELTRLLSALKRLEECREKLVALFVNRRKNVVFWDLIRQMTTKLVEMKEKREQKKLEWKKSTNESNRFWNPFVESGPIVSVSVGNVMAHGWA